MSPSFIVLLFCGLSTLPVVLFAAHLPALRHPPDDKRTLASRLLRNAASHKHNSLRDVLATSRRHPRKASGTPYPSPSPTSHSFHTEFLHSVAEQLFPSDDNSTGSERPALALHLDVADSREQQYSKYSKYSKSDSTSPHSSTRSFSGRLSSSSSSSSVHGDRYQHDATDRSSEQQLLRQSVAALSTDSPIRVTTALRNLQELCHSIHNAHALEQSGGLNPVLDALSSPHRRIRATAAWAVATCSQNNPSVQRAVLRRGAIPTLARIAWTDHLVVRARALFALNALVAMDDARLAFENLPFATQLVLHALRDPRDVRATRRTLNLLEILVARNLDAWKTQLEAWDIPPLVETLMREHADVDVRESAARIIAALDGRPLA